MIFLAIALKVYSLINEVVELMRDVLEKSQRVSLREGEGRDVDV